MTALHTLLLVFTGCAAGIATCGLMKHYPDPRSARALIGLAVIAIAGVVLLAVFMPQPSCYQPAHVQAVWLDGAWRCITTEQAG